MTSFQELLFRFMAWHEKQALIPTGLNRQLNWRRDLQTQSAESTLLLQ
jgi:hypothetical protein